MYRPCMFPGWREHTCTREGSLSPAAIPGIPMEKLTDKVARCTELPLAMTRSESTGVYD